MDYLALKFVHVVGATVILGTGTGIAFFMFAAHLDRDVSFVARTAGAVVVADLLFTASAVVVQPVTGYLLARKGGIPFDSGWLARSIILYAVAAAAWLPVVWIQVRMRDLARKAAADGTVLPPGYGRLFRLWCLLGIPGFGATVAILWLMVTKP